MGIQHGINDLILLSFCVEITYSILESGRAKDVRRTMQTHRFLKPCANVVTLPTLPSFSVPALLCSQGKPNYLVLLVMSA